MTVGLIAPALFALIQFPTVWQANAVIFVVIQVVATVVGNMIYPRLQAATQNIDPLATILSLSFWILLWGLAGRLPRGAADAHVDDGVRAVREHGVGVRDAVERR